MLWHHIRAFWLFSIMISFLIGMRRSIETTVTMVAMPRPSKALTMTSPPSARAVSRIAAAAAVCREVGDSSELLGMLEATRRHAARGPSWSASG